MTVRESLNRNSMLVSVVAVAAFVLGSGITFVYMKDANKPPAPPPPAKAFYTADDGKTWFADDAAKPYPFDRGGAVAYRAYVFSCGLNGAPFTAYLQRIEEGALEKVRDAAASGTKTPRDIEQMVLHHLEVKKPGDETWVKADSPEGDAVTSVVCPPPASAAGTTTTEPTTGPTTAPSGVAPRVVLP